MTSTLLNITKKVDPNTLAILQSVMNAAQNLSIPLFVIGATARDLGLHYQYGAAISRATQDLDFAIQIPDWAAFDALKDEMYGQESMMETYGWVPECGSAFLLGRDVSAIAAQDTHVYLKQLFGEEIVNRSMRDLIRESCETNRQFEVHEARINAFIDGYQNL